MEQTVQVMMQLIKSEIMGAPLDLSVSEALSDEFLAKLYSLSRRHDMSHLVASSLNRNGILPKTPEGDKLKNSILTAAFRCDVIEKDFERACRVLNESKIPFIPLKGSILRDYYPEKWMRTSGDIDILVHKEDVDRAVQSLRSELDCEYIDRGTHDIQLRMPGKVHLELHFDLVESDRIGKAEILLNDVWSYASPDGDSYFYRLSDDMFYYYHIAHMAKHIEGGGCGIRPFADLWILENKISHNNEKRDALLEKGGLLTFANAARKLTAVWFDGGSHNDISYKLQSFLLYGGSFGNDITRTAVRRTKNGGKFRYIFNRIWIPYDSLKIAYPVLEKHKWLYPFYGLVRMFKVIKNRGLDGSVNTVKTINGVSKDKCNEISEMMKELGLE